MLSDNIRNYRKSNNMSQDELAGKLDVSRQSISLWETGQTQPTLENIVSLAKIFNISADELLNEQGGGATAKSKKNKDKKKIVILLCVIIAAVLAAATAILLFVNTDSDSSGQGDSVSKSRVVKQAVESSKTDKVSSRKTTVAAKPKQTKSTAQSKQEVQTEAAAAKTVDMFTYFKNFAIKNGKTSGDHSYFSKTADTYGGNYEEDFSLYYWADSDRVEFCLHSVIDDTYSINFYIYVPQDFTGSYSYLTSYYYRESGESVYEAKGTIKAADFNKSYPLNCTRYIGPVEDQTAYMEISRQGICDLIDCIKNFAKKENLEFNIHDMGFVKF